MNKKIDILIYFFSLIKIMTEIVIPKDLFTSIKTIIRYQNILLLKEIASDNNWNYMELKKKKLILRQPNKD